MSIVSNLTISGFKVFNNDCDGNETINATIGSSGIYKYQAASISSLSQTVYLTNGSARGGAQTVDTLSVMVETADVSDLVEINGYSATRGVGNTAGAYTIPWAVWASQAVSAPNVPQSAASGNSPAYTVDSAGAGAHYLTQVLIASTYNTNQSLSVIEGTNNLIIEIWNAGRTLKKATLTYYVVIVSSSTRLSSLIPALSPSVLVPGYSYSPVFDSRYCEYENQVYTLNVDPSATSMTLTPNATLSGSEAVIRITVSNPSTGAIISLAPLLSGQTSASFAIVDNASVDVSVTAPDGITVQRYVLSIQSDVSGNDLSGAVFSYYNTTSALTAFGTTTADWASTLNPTPANLAIYTEFSYINTIPNISYGVSVTLTAVDSGASVAVGSATPVPSSGTFLVPYSSLIQGARNTIVAKCISSTGVIKLYNFNIWLAGSDVSPSVSGNLSNISFISSQAILDPSNPFVSTTVVTSTSLNFTNATVGIPAYSVFMAPAVAGSVTLSIILNYNDYGSRFSTSIDNGVNWVPVGPLNSNISTDNWTLGAQRTASVSITVPASVVSGSPVQVLVASHLPAQTAPGYNSSNIYYGYLLNVYPTLANLNSLRLYSTETNAPISLTPVFNGNVLTYSAYIGTASAPTNKVNIATTFGSGSVVDWSIASATTAYVPGQALTSGATPLTITLGALPAAVSYTLYVRMWNATTPANESAYYTINLLNVDASLVLNSLSVYNQNNQDPVTGVWPAPSTPAVTIAPTFNANTFVYNAPISALNCAIQPTVLNPGVKTITISVNGGLPQVVVSGSYFRFPMSSRNIAVQLTITDNLTPSNSNSYMIFVYSTSADLNISLANFSGILNSAFSPVLPDGVVVTTPLTVASGGSASVTCSNALVPTTTFTATPEQSGTSMYLSTGLGFEPLAPGVASSVINLPPSSTTPTVVPVWMYANNNTSTGTYNFSITRVNDINNLLASMVLTNCTNFVFNPATQSYSGIILVAPNTQFSFTPTSASAYATIQYSFNGSALTNVVSGATVDITSTNYNPTPNTLIINVTSQAGIVRVYTFNILRNPNYYLSNLRVYTSRALALASTTSSTTDLVPINPSPFSPTFYTYSAEVLSNIDTAYVVLSKAPESSIAMSNATNIGLNASSEQVWAVPVQVTTTPQNTLVYAINPSAITVSVASVGSSVYNLAIVRQYPVATAQSISLSIGGLNIPLNSQLGVPTVFDPLVFTYTISSIYSGSVDVSIVGQGSNTYYLNGSPYYVPVGAVINVSHPIVVRVVNIDGSSSLYQISLL